jgi:hypothetical protein
MRLPPRCCFALVALALPATALAQSPVAEWKLFTSPDSAFSVRMPGEPKASGEPPQVTYLVRIGRDVTYYVFTSPFRTFPTDLSIEELLEASRDAALEPLREYGGRLLWSESGRASGEPCITFLEEATPKGFPRTRVLTRIIFDVGELRIFSITHSAPADGFQEPRAKEFISSFTLLHGPSTQGQAGHDQPAGPAAESFGKSLQKKCARLQSDGWTAPIDLQTKKRGKAEWNFPGVMYMCTLTHGLRPAGSGHAPDLQALLSNDYGSRGPSLILSADIWCAADRTATFDALAKQLERIAGSVPAPISAAIRAGKEAKATAGGLSFEVTPVEVDSGACESVPAGKLGPVLMKIDVEVKPAK